VIFEDDFHASPTLKISPSWLVTTKFSLSQPITSFDAKTHHFYPLWGHCWCACAKRTTWNL